MFSHNFNFGFERCFLKNSVYFLLQQKSIMVGAWERKRGRRGGLMVSALDSGSDIPGSSPGRGTALCSWARHFTPIVPLSAQVYKWVPANLVLGVTLRWTSIPSRGEKKYS